MWGILKAIRWIIELDVNDVTIETDSMFTVKALHDDSTNFLKVGFMIIECRALVTDRPDISISYVRKQAKKVAHVLSRLLCEANFYKDFSSPP